VAGHLRHAPAGFCYSGHRKSSVKKKDSELNRSAAGMAALAIVALARLGAGEAANKKS